MPIRLSGMTSGLDTDAIVQELVSAYSLKTEKYEKQQTKLEWKQDAWKTLNTKIYGLYTNVSNMRMSGTYNLKKTTVSDNTKATVTANSDAVTGTQKLNILQTAQASYITGGKLGDEVTANTKMSELGYKDGDTSFHVETRDGEKHEIKITKSTTVKEVIDQLKEAGINASFDATNKRIFISAKESGEKNDFNLVSYTENGLDVLKRLGLNTALIDDKGNFINGAEKYTAAYEEYKKAMAAGASSVAEYVENQRAAYKDYQDQIEEKEKSKEVHQEVIDKYNYAQERLEARNAFDSIYYSLTGSGILGFTQSDLQEMVKTIGASGKEITEETIQNYIKETDGTSFNEADAAKIAEILNANKTEVGTVASYTKTNNNLLWKDAAALTQELQDMEQGYQDAKAAIDSIDAEIESLNEAKKPYNIYAVMTEEDIEKLIEQVDIVQKIINDPASKEGAAHKITGVDAKIKINGVEFTNATNSFSINGLTINAEAVTGDGDDNAISITTNLDTQGIYDKIKDFLTEYNTVINEMTRLYNAESARDYEPLTDEEREAMSDEQIEKWENKIKESLLRRDDSLNSVMSAMINSMSQSFEVNGQKLSLGTFGISTLGFLNSAEHEQYAFHIDGDEDDENTSGKKDKLMKAIETDPEQLMEFMQKLMNNLYTSIDEKMKSTEMSSAYKVYNDKEMDKEATRIAQMISKWEDKISEKEEYYYDKFTQMEVALSKLQNQTSSISGLLGMQ